MPNDGGGGSSKGMEGGYAGGERRWQVNRVEGAGAVTASEHNMCGKVAYGEAPGVELHRALVVTSEATNREEGMS